MKEYNGIMKKIIDEAKKSVKTIVLPESTDKRVLEAANEASKEKIADIILVGKKEEILNVCKENNIELDSNIKIVDNTIAKTEEEKIRKEKYINELYNLRKHKGMTLEKAEEILKDNVYFATMMVKLKDADGMVSGAIHSTADTLRPALQIIKTKEGVKTVSAFFLMETKKEELGSKGVYIFADCGLVEFPTEEELYDIVISSVKSFRELVAYDTPRVALLSYSTLGSAKNEKIDKVINVKNRLENEKVDFDFDGELQLDAAIIKEVALLKAPSSKVAGKANILIFPDLQAGNIGYKLVQRFGDALALRTNNTRFK